MMRWMKRGEIEEIRSNTDTDLCSDLCSERSSSQKHPSANLSLSVGQTEIVYKAIALSQLSN